MRIYLIGFMGAGKTHLAKILGKRLGCPYYDLDEIIAQQEGRSINKIFEEEGEEYFRQAEQRMLKKISEDHVSMVLSCGGGAPCFSNNMDYMNEAGITVWLNPSLEILLGRLRHGKYKRPLLKNLDDAQLKEFIIKKNAERAPQYGRAKIMLDDRFNKIETLLKQLSNV